MCRVQRRICVDILSDIMEKTLPQENPPARGKSVIRMLKVTLDVMKVESDVLRKLGKVGQKGENESSMCRQVLWWLQNWSRGGDQISGKLSVSFNITKISYPISPSARPHRCAKGTYRGLQLVLGSFESGSTRPAKTWRHLAEIKGTIMIN